MSWFIASSLWQTSARFRCPWSFDETSSDALLEDLALQAVDPSAAESHSVTAFRTADELTLALPPLVPEAPCFHVVLLHWLLPNAARSRFPAQNLSSSHVQEKSPATTLLVTSNHKLEELKGKIRLFNAYKWLAYHFNPHCLKVQVTWVVCRTDCIASAEDCCSDKSLRFAGFSFAKAVWPLRWHDSTKKERSTGNACLVWRRPVEGYHTKLPTSSA